MTVELEERSVREIREIDRLKASPYSESVGVLTSVLHRPIDPAEHRAKGLETGESPSAIIRCVLGRCLADPPSRGTGFFVRGRRVRLNGVWSGG
jgi:hypothetical protein